MRLRPRRRPPTRGAPVSEPSPYVAIRISRKRAEELLEVLRVSQRSKTKPHRKAVLRALRENANGRVYSTAEDEA